MASLILDSRDQLCVPAETLAGADEAGRGPLAGAVVAAAVILPERYQLPGLNDSKKISEKKRQQLALDICEEAVAWCIASASVAEIDTLNILHASLLAMQRAVEGLSTRPSYVAIDGNKLPRLDRQRYHCEAFVGGDARIAAISAASILAKVERDRELMVLAETYPGYGFEKHKGYPTKAHREALEKLGPCPAHRRSFAPVAKLLPTSMR